MSPIRVPFRIAGLATLTAVATLVPLSQAVAVDFCVGTASEFRNALMQSANNNSNDEIRLQSGVFQVNDGENSPAFDGEVSRTLVISGGWTAACTSQSGNAESTVLDGNNTRPVLRLKARAGASGQLVLRYLTVRRGYSNSSAGGLFVDLDNSAMSLVADTLIVRDNTSLISHSYAGGLSVFDGGGSVRLRNSLFTGNTGARFGALSLYIHSASHLSNNTITGNTALFNVNNVGGVYLSGLGSGQVQMSNNVLHRNNLGNGTLALQSTSNVVLSLHDNLITGIRSVAPSTTESGTLDADPRFVSTALPVPLPNSPLRNRGRNNLPGGQSTYDLAGLQRVQEGRIDIGAYEFSPQVFDEIFANGVELP